MSAAPRFRTPIASPDSTDQVPTGDEVMCVKCTTCRSSIPIDQLNEHSTSCIVDASVRHHVRGDASANLSVADLRLV
jgi:heterodisulfide reductase subunit C